MKSTGSQPRKRKHLTHTTGRASRRNRNKGVNEDQPLPRPVIWIIAGFVIMAAIIVLLIVI